MKKALKKIFVGTLAATMLFSSVCLAASSPVVAPKPVANKTAVAAEKVNGITPSVKTTDKGVATLTAVAKTTKKTVKIADKVTVNGVDYAVTTVAKNAFKKASKVKTVELPSTIKTISSKAFATNKKLTKVVLTGTKAPKVSKAAFKGLTKKQKSKIVVTYNKKMSKKQVKALKKSLKAAGIKASNIKAVK